MSTKTFLITGANRGLGHHLARHALAHGHAVVATGRSTDALREAFSDVDNASLKLLPLDVASDDSVAQLVQALDENGIAVDVLVNNAGRFLDDMGASAMQTSVETVEETSKSNVSGPIRLMQAFLPGMNARGYGRVVNVSSGMGAMSDMGGGSLGYRLSKAALNAATLVFAHEASHNVKVNAVCPGWVRTDMGGQGATRSPDEGIAGIYWAATLDDDGPHGGFFRDGEAIDW